MSLSRNPYFDDGDNNVIEVPGNLFEIRKCENCIYLLTNNTDIAGYIFGTSKPNVKWQFDIATWY